jgi:hypothetical protein
MRRTACTLALFLFAVAAAPANAAPFTPQLERDYAAANRYWGGPPANCTSVERAIVPDTFIDVIAEATIPSEPELCHLWVIRSLARSTNFGFTCAVIVHESGHLHGLEHETNPASIMFPGFPIRSRVPGICWRLERTLDRKEGRA